MTFSSDMRILPNGLVVPVTFEPSKIDEYALKEQNCQKLKAELMLELKRSNFTELKQLFKERGAEFLIEMFRVDPWKNVSNKGRSILENVLEEINFNLPDEILTYLLNYVVNHSEQAKATNMNLLHMLARNCSSSKVVDTLKNAVVQYPDLLKDRMSLGEGLDMTPVEMTIRTSYNESLMNFMLTKYQESMGCLTTEDKSKLLSHAKWLSGSGIYSTALIGERLMERINKLPETV
jgi:hypothetical protein